MLPLLFEACDEEEHESELEDNEAAPCMPLLVVDDSELEAAESASESESQFSDDAATAAAAAAIVSSGRLVAIKLLPTLRLLPTMLVSQLEVLLVLVAKI